MNAFLTFIKYFTAVLPTVIAVEQSIGSAAPGSAKKQIVLGAIQAGAVAAGQSIPEPHVQAISGLIDATVTNLNQTLSVFGKVQPAAAPVAVAAAAGA